MDDISVLVPVLKQLGDLTELRLGLQNNIHAYETFAVILHQHLSSTCRYSFLGTLAPDTTQQHPNNIEHGLHSLNIRKLCC